MTPAGERATQDLRELARLQSCLDSIVSDALDGRQEAILLDAPAYRNAGDLLILRGTLEVLHRLGVRVRWIQDWTLTSWSRLTTISPRTAVLMQGGGNFGGLYPEHDTYRARVLATLPDPSAAIVMPQSVHFPSVGTERVAHDLYAPFPMATYLIRDSRSAQQLCDVIPEIAGAVRLCPDAAFGTSLTREHPAEHDVFVLQRQDSESTGLDLRGSLDSLGLDVAHGDWPSFATARPAYRGLRRLTTTGERWRQSLGRRPSRWSHVAVGGLERAWVVPQRFVLLAHISDHVEQARATVERGRVLVTDRLHGHVVASLMGVPNVALNNQDGKVEALVNDWTRGLSTTRLAHTPQEIAGEVEGFLNA